MLDQAYRKQVLYRLIIITWESAVPPCTCAFAAMIAGAAGVCATLSPLLKN
jgi:hypothetical protein